MSIMIDVDGVLVDFTLGFSKLANWLSDDVVPQSPTLTHKRWSFVPALMSKATFSKTWKYINENPMWWGTLGSLDVDWDELDNLTYHKEVYFVTSRPKNSRQYTRRWLEDHGLGRPQVIFTKKKGELARVVEATHAIDDKLENAWCVHWLSGKTKSYILDRPYNQTPVNIDAEATGVIRIAAFEDFMREVHA